MNLNPRATPKCVRAVIGVAAVLLSLSPISGQSQQERFTGFAINMNSGPKTGTIDFMVERWSTDEERNALLAILQEEKDATRANAQLLKALQKMPKAGNIRTPQTLAWDLRYAHQAPLEGGGRRIVVATDRPIGFREARNQSRSMDYPFTLVEIRLDASDRGEGKILAGTRLLVDKNNHLVLENYGQQPIRFNEIRKLK
jgi:hypothetical protein